MSGELWVSVALAVIAAAALYFTGIAAVAAKRQTAIQRELRKAAAQPYVWADLRPDPAQRGLLVLVIGNSGPTVATDVRVRFEPVLQDHGQQDHTRAIRRLRNNGIASLPPGRVMEWTFGPVVAHMSEGTEAIRYDVEITGKGPFGPLDVNTYSIALEDLRQTWAAGVGSLRLVAEAIDKAGERIAKSALQQ